MKILAFAGSNSSQSINKALVQFVLNYFEEADKTLIDLNDYEMPLFSVDKEKQYGIPQLAHDFLKLIEEHDAIVLSLAEHNKIYSVAFKNVLDWCSRAEVKVFQEKPVLLLSTSPGRAGGANVMKHALEYFPTYGARVWASFSLPSFNRSFEGGRVTDTSLLEELEKHIETFKTALRQEKSGI